MSSVAPVRITRDLRLMVASVLERGAEAEHLRALTALAQLLRQRGDDGRFVCADADGGADRARNALLGALLASDCSYLLLVDGAIGFDPAAVLAVIERMQADPALAMIAAPCPARFINWSLVATAQASGIGADNPLELERFGGQFALDFLRPEQGVRLDEPVELAGAEAGLMVIRREVIEALCAAHPDLRYTPTPQDRAAGEIGESLYALFQSTIDPASARHLSGAMLFCYRARAAGFRLWLAPWLRTTNTGTARFIGSLADLAALEPPAPPPE
jgi:hypothetical protein